MQMGRAVVLMWSLYLFRKLDCDIRIQLPQVSKEHCKIELNENKEVRIILWYYTINLNLSFVSLNCFFAHNTWHTVHLSFLSFKLILTNLSSVNPTRINGQVFNQSERLKHGDLITIIDRSFR